MLFLSLMACTHVQSARIAGGISTRQEAGGEDCSATTCTTFRESASCSCAPFVKVTEDSATLERRAKAVIVDLLQTQRYLSDYLTADSSAILKFWRGRRLGGSKGTLEFLEGALKHLPNVTALVETIPVGRLSPEAFPLPAGALPIMIEVWHDTRSMFGNEFLGEAGLPLANATTALRLTDNPNRGSRPAQGSVSVSVKVSRSDSPFNCSQESFGLRCQRIDLRVRCLAAAGLASGVNPYCKVRVKEQGLGRSHKAKTETVYGTSSPTFEASEASYSWEVPLIKGFAGDGSPPEGGLVPWTLDELTIGEQTYLNVYYLAKHVFMDEKKCAGKRASIGCKLIQQLGSMSVDRATLAEAASLDPGSSELSTAATELAENLGDASPPSSSFLDAGAGVALEQHLGNPIFAAIIINNGRRGGYRGGGGGLNAGGEQLFTGMLVFMILFMGLLVLIA